MSLIVTMTTFTHATDDITEETVILEQNFTGLTELPKGWTVHYGNWYVSYGKLHQSYITTDLMDYPLPLLTFDEVGYLENFRFEATLQFEDQGTFIAWMGLAFDISNFDVPYPDPLQLTAAGVYSYGVDFRIMDTMGYGTFPNFGAPSSTPKAPYDGEPFRIVIEVYGEYGDIYFDDTLLISSAKITRWGEAGVFGLIMGFGGVGSYDDIKITALPYRTPSITTENLLDGTIGLRYIQKLVSEGDKITWNIATGYLPDGLSLSSDGIISGTPITSGFFVFTVKSENAKGYDSQILSITVNGEYESSFGGSGGIDFSSGDIELVSTHKLSGSPKTFEAWVKMPTTLGISGGVIVGNGALDGYGAATINFGVTADGNPWLYWKETTGNEAYYVAYANVALDDWVHVAIVTDSVNHKIICYVNGVTADAQTFSIMEDTIPIRPLKIGGDYLWGNVRCFSGEIADVRVWSVMRSESEIQASMNTYLIGDEMGLLANWLLTGDIDVIYKDNSIQGNDVRVWYEWLEPEFVTGDYAIIVVPDIQHLTLHYPDVLEALINWVIENVQECNIQLMIQVGDLTNDNTENEWQLVQDNFAKLDGVVPYIFIPGNHDYAGMPYYRDTNLFNTYLPYAKYSAFPTFGGAYENDKLDNAYYYFTSDDATYLMLCLETVPREPVIDWANNVVDDNPNCRVIVVTHAYLSYDGRYDDSSGYDATGNNGQNVWDKLVSQHANIVLTLCGHIHYDDLVLQVGTGLYGNEVPQLLVDAQDMDWYHKGVGMIALLTFSNDGRDVAVNWYSVKENKLFRDWNQFTFSIELGTYRVLFDTQGGSIVPKQTIEHGGLLTQPDAPTRSGYTFAGWYYGEIEFNFNVPIKTNMVLTAIWEETKPTIDSVTPIASVKQLNGNKNDLTITLTEKLSDGTTNMFSQTFSINNNAADTYTVGTYRVYVDTKGNTQIRACYIV